MNDVKKSKQHDPMEPLIRAVFAAGFRLGHKYGSDAATAYEWGTRSHEPQTPEDAWEQDIKWRLDNESTGFDIASPESWHDVD